ncbi:unnamed protein product [Candida verbasci]|uniref:Alcohol acetyltransferase n=1 Tax=Candida verbasci TaxID=1227364 RepID=A0A9W4TZ19_9ASCO|nr:unnamed protein product [Candida verbasci]
MDLRKPSFFERYQLHRTVNKYYSNFNITIEYPQFTKEQLSQALKSLIQAHPILSCNFFKTDEIEDDCRNYVLRPFEVKFDDVVSYTNYEITPEYFQYLNSIYFNLDEKKPLWKILVNGNYVTIVCNHTYLDGNSGVGFHNELIANLKNQDCQFESILTNGNITSVPVPIDDVSNLYKPSLFFKIYEIGKHYLLPKEECFKTIPISIGQKVNYRILQFTNHELQHILTRSKSLKFTSYFLSCAVKVFRQFHNDKSVSLAIPMNGRRYDNGLDMFQICTAASNIIVNPEINDDKVGEYISTKLATDLNTRNPFYVVGLLRLMNIGNLLKDKIGSFDRSTMEVSNVGKLNVMNGWFSQDNGFSSHLQFNIMTSNSGLSIVLGSHDEVEDIMKEYVDMLKAELLN